jgi:hypothetical protein
MFQAAEVTDKAVAAFGGTGDVDASMDVRNLIN